MKQYQGDGRRSSRLVKRRLTQTEAPDLFFLCATYAFSDCTVHAEFARTFATYYEAVL